MLLRIFAAFVLGGLIGLEREKNNHPAGFRTHILVCLGSALVMLLSMYGFSEFADEPNVRLDPARLAAQVISGIGFLGAGVILTKGISVKGLTTAASLWVIAGIGLSVGAGFYIPAVMVTVLVLFSLLILNKVERKWLTNRKDTILRVQSDAPVERLEQFHEMMDKYHLEVRNMRVKVREASSESGQIHTFPATYWFTLRGRDKDLLKLIHDMMLLDGVNEVRTE
ncbi:MgtC/SapB family protein [Marinicrinis lubricantis]